jgi:hypothetical protein
MMTIVRIVKLDDKSVKFEDKLLSQLYRDFLLILLN